MITDQVSKRREKTRLLYIQAFLRLIAEREFDKITVTDIANEANYGRWMFYQYFQNKEDIAYAAFVHWMTQLDAYVVDAVKDLESPHREYVSWKLLFRTFAQQKLFFTRISASVTVSARMQIKNFLVQQFLNHLQTERFTLMPGVQPEIAARLFVASVMELLEYWMNAPEQIEIDTLVDQLFIFVFKSLPPS